MVIDPNWSFSELSDNLKRLKKEYIFSLAFFSYHDNLIQKLKIENAYKREIRNSFYKINIKEWQIDMAWEYMNGYVPFTLVSSTARRMDRTSKKC